VHVGLLRVIQPVKADALSCRSVIVVHMICSSPQP
jgi:hypothetical protein